MESDRKRFLIHRNNVEMVLWGPASFTWTVCVVSWFLSAKLFGLTQDVYLRFYSFSHSNWSRHRHIAAATIAGFRHFALNVFFV